MCWTFEGVDTRGITKRGVYGNDAEKPIECVRCAVFEASPVQRTNISCGWHELLHKPIAEECRSLLDQLHHHSNSGGVFFGWRTSDWNIIQKGKHGQAGVCCYLEAGTLCKGIPETVALPVGLDTDVFPPGTTISSA